MLAEVEILEVTLPLGVAVRIRDRAYEVVESYRCYTGGGTEPKSCTCPDYRYRGKKICKHMRACQEVAKRW